MIAEKSILENIPYELEASWIVSYLATQKFSPAHFTILKSKTGLSDKNLARILSITPKTLTTYRKDASIAKIATKEHVLMFLSLIKHGTNVFGTSQDFNHWLKTPNIFLDNRSPLDFLNTTSGIRLIDNRLTAMEYGDNI